MEKITFNLHFTDFCNFKCKHCFINKENNELEISEIKLIGDKIAAYAKNNKKQIRVNLAGGEPLCSKNIQEIIDYYFSLGLELSIITNGYYLDESFLKKNVNKLTMIGISVDSLNEKNNIDIGRCTSNFITIDETKIITLTNLIKKYGYKLKINVCINKFNKNEDLSNLFDLVKPDRIKILRVLCSYTNEFSISDLEWDNITKRYEKYNPQYEDNDYMRQAYYIIDSRGNLAKDNSHVSNNSILTNSIEDCLYKLNEANYSYEY